MSCAVVHFSLHCFDACVLSDGVWVVLHLCVVRVILGERL